MVRLAAVIVLSATFGGGLHAAQLTVARQFEHLDLYGAWAPDCAQEASPANPHVAVAAGPEGSVIEQDEFGADYAVNRYIFVAARRMSGHRLAVDALFQQGEAEPQRQLIVMHIVGKTRRTLFTGTGDEPPLVKDGIAVALGKPTPTLNKCD